MINMINSFCKGSFQFNFFIGVYGHKDNNGFYNFNYALKLGLNNLVRMNISLKSTQVQTAKIKALRVNIKLTMSSVIYFIGLIAGIQIQSESDSKIENPNIESLIMSLSAQSKDNIEDPLFGLNLSEKTRKDLSNFVRLTQDKKLEAILNDNS